MSHTPSTISAVNFGEALRGMWALVWAQRSTTGTLVRWGLGACALGFLMLLTIRSGQEKEWLGWVIGFYIQFLLPLTCLNVCGSMMRAEVQANTLSFLCTRPLRRHTLFLLQYLCHVFWLQLIFFAGTLGLFALGVVKQAEGLGALLPTMLLTQFLAIFAWSALSALLGLLHQRFVVIGILYWLIVEVGLGMVETSNINQLSILRHIHTLLGQNEMVADLFVSWSSTSSISAGIVLCVATFIFLVAGAALFTYREYLPSQEAGQ
ncbi:MAG: ABC transporter permease [Verrucomicrobia subdivision 3 bacterium]|nr:ABC transporter permease [Limisphaerales bacterium]